MNFLWVANFNLKFGFPKKKPQAVSILHFTLVISIEKLYNKKQAEVVERQTRMLQAHVPIGCEGSNPFLRIIYKG